MPKPLEIPYIEIMKESLKLVWKKRYLWWFGLFASLINGGGMNYYYNFSDSSQTDNVPFSKEQVYSFISDNIEWIMAVGIFFIFLLIVFIALGFLGRGALIDSIQKEMNGKIATFKSGMVEGKNNFWKIFSISVSAGIFIFSAFILISLPVIFLFYSQSYVAGTLMAFLGLLILFPLAILMGYIKIYGYLYAVIGRLSFWPSIERAYWLFQKNIWASLIMGLLFIALNFLMGIAALMAIIPAAIVFFAIGFLFYFIAGKIGAIIIAALGALIIIAAMLIIRTIYEVFAQSVWIKFFHAIGKAPEEETITELEVSPIPEKPLPIIDSKLFLK